MKHVKFHLPSFLRRVRIHGEEFDSSARAMNRVNGKGSLMSYESALAVQADLRIVRGSTNERKQMSTKTTFKRIALVAVAALGFGVLSVAPSQAAGMLADTLVNAVDGTSVVSSAGTVGSPVTAKLVFSGIATGTTDSATVSGVILSVPATSSAFAVSVAKTAAITVNVNAVDTVTSGVIVANGAAGRVTKYVTATFTPDVSGTYIIALKSAGGVSNQTVTWTITTAAIPAATAAASTVAFYSKAVNGAGGVPGTSPRIIDDYIFSRYTVGQTLDATLTTFADNAPATGVFSEPVTPANAGDIVGSGIVHYSNATVLAANTAAATPLTVSISGRGYVGIGTNPVTTYGTTVTESPAVGFTPFGDPDDFGRMKFFFVKSDGTSGPATITVSAGGVVLGTVDMVFTGAKASLALATAGLSKKYIGSGDTATVTITGLDASKNILTASGITTVTGSDTTGTIATAVIVGDVVTVTGGLVSGAVTWTVTDGTLSVTFVTNTTKKTGTFVLGFDAASYGPGEKVTWTVTGKDSNGSPIADGSRAVFGSVSANLAVGTLGVGSLPGTTLTFVNGVATGSFFAPATVSGSFNLTTTIGAADAAYATATAAALAAATVTSFSIVNAAADAATDAANDALDAANAATEAALSAAEAADAATTAAQEASDAVAALSESVTQLIAALQAQIKSLTKVVNKIAKKVKA